MKNTDKLRTFLNQNGYYLKKDFIFKAENKFYTLIIAERGSEVLTSEQIEYGKDNLTNPSKDFLEYLSEQIKSKRKILKGLSGEKYLQYEQIIQKELALYERLRTL